MPSRALAAYWGEALGGPAAYSDAYGNETSVARGHSDSGAHQDVDRRAMRCFDQALADVGLASDRVGAFTPLAMRRRLAERRVGRKTNLLRRKRDRYPSLCAGLFSASQ
jgi:truncated hemoglobin YjbI